MSWWQLLQQEIKMLFIKDTRRAIFLFGASAAYIILFALLYSSHVINTVPLVVYDEDQTVLSRSLVQAFEDSEKYEVVAEVSTLEEMNYYIKEKKAYAALDIPLNFERDVKRGNSSNVLVEANGANIAIANAVLTTAQEIVGTFSGGAAAKLVEATGQLPDIAVNKIAPIQYSMRVLNNPTLSYMLFFVIGLGMTALQQGIFLSVSASMISLYQNIHEFKGAHPLKIISAKLLPYWFCGTLAFVMTVQISIQIFDMPCKGSWYDLVLLGTTFSFAATTLASLLSAFFKNEVTFTQFSLIYSVISFIYSGYMWPQHAMNTFALILSHSLPLAYFADSVRAILISGHAPLLENNILILLGSGTVLLICSILMLSYKSKQLNTTASKENMLTQS